MSEWGFLALLQKHLLARHWAFLLAFSLELEEEAWVGEASCSRGKEEEAPFLCLNPYPTSLVEGWREAGEVLYNKLKNNIAKR